MQRCVPLGAAGLGSHKQVDPDIDLRKGEGERRECEGTKPVRKDVHAVWKTPLALQIALSVLTRCIRLSGNLQEWCLWRPAAALSAEIHQFFSVSCSPANACDAKPKPLPRALP